MSVSPTGSRTKAVVPGTANTLEKAHLIILSNASEKGDKFFRYIFRGAGATQLASALVYSIQFCAKIYLTFIKIRDMI